MPTLRAWLERKRGSVVYCLSVSFIDQITSMSKSSKSSEESIDNSNHLIKKARLSDASLPFITHHGSYLRAHLNNKAVQENACFSDF